MTGMRPVQRIRAFFGTMAGQIFLILTLGMSVAAIIALLVAILLPALNKARVKAKVTQCLAHLNATGNLFTTYAADNEGHYPWHRNWWPDYVKDNHSNDPVSQGTDMRDLMRDYEDVDPEFYYCPLNHPYPMGPDWITEPGTPGSGWGGWNTFETYINISYYWYANFESSFDADPVFFNGGKIPKRLADGKADVALAADPLTVPPSEIEQIEIEGARRPVL